MSDNNNSSIRILDFGLVLLLSKITMVLAFLIFSYIPLLSSIIFFLPQIPFGDTKVLTTYIVILLLLWGLVTLFGILTMSLRLRELGSILFVLGSLFSSNDPYFLSLGIVISWIFYELWFVVSQSQQLLRDYDSYPTHSIERRKLYNLFQNQVFSFGLLAWIVLSMTWFVLFLAENFYVELGKEFGSIGISLSIAILILLLLFQKIYGPVPKVGQY